jgi:hypothetical protein
MFIIIRAADLPSEVCATRYPLLRVNLGGCDAPRKETNSCRGSPPSSLISRGMFLRSASTRRRSKPISIS